MQVNCRHIPAFFLGCVFIAAVNSLFSSTFLQCLFARILGSKSPTKPRDLNLDSRSEKAYSLYTDSSTSLNICLSDSRLLIFIMSLCFASASITLFASLLSFPIGGGAACAFVVAWSGIASEAGRIVGLLILLLELRRLGIQRWESIVFIVWLLIGLVFVFVDNALATGVTLLFKTLAVSLCTRKHFLPASLTVSLIYILLEAYTVVRLWSFLIPRSLQFRRQLGGFRDARILKGASLLFLEFLTMVPSAVSTNVFGDFLPFSIGSLAVLLAFSVKLPFEESRKEMLMPSPSFHNSGWSGRSVRRTIAPTIYSVATTDPSVHLPALHQHPFSSKSLADTTRHSTDWPDLPQTARSTRTIDTVAARSIRNAVVQVAKRTLHPFNQEMERLVPPSATPTDCYLTPQSASSRIVPSQTALADKMELDAKMPPAAMVRPRLMIVTTPTLDFPGNDFRPDSPALQPMQRTGFRLTPQFISGAKSYLSMSSSSFSVQRPVSQLSRSLPSSPDATGNRQSTMTTSAAVPLSDGSFRSETHTDAGRPILTRNITFGERGSRFRALGYVNPIQSRWSSSTTSQGTGSQGASHPLPLPFPPEWPRPPPLVLSPATGRPRITSAV